MSLKQKTLSGLVWTFTQQFGTQIINFVVSLVLARLLLPSDFGTIAVFGVLMGVGNVLIDSGLTNSLIRTQKIDDTDLSTVFYFNLVISLIVYILLAATAPHVSIFFDMPELIKIIRVYAIVLPISAFSSIQRTILTKNMDFKTQLKIQMPALIVSGGVGILLAFLGFGAWALVYMAITQASLSSLQFWIYSNWRPKVVFDLKKFKTHFNFGYKLALSSFIGITFDNLYTIVIGKVFSASELGFYNKANSIQQLIVKSITTPLNKVTYPLFSSIQNNNERLKSAYSQSMRMVLFIIAPLLTIMAILSEPLIRFLYTDKWLPAVPYFKILCIVGILYPINVYNLNILQVKGRSDLYLKLEILKKTLVVLAIATTFEIGIIAMLWGRVITTIIALFINCHYSGKFLNYNLWNQMVEFLPILLLSAFVGLVIFIFDANVLLISSDLIRITFGGFFAILLYVTIAYLFRFKEIHYLKDLLLDKKSLR